MIESSLSKYLFTTDCQVGESKYVHEKQEMFLGNNYVHSSDENIAWNSKVDLLKDSKVKSIHSFTSCLWILNELWFLVQNQ